MGCEAQLDSELNKMICKPSKLCQTGWFMIRLYQ